VIRVADAHVMAMRQPQELMAQMYVETWGYRPSMQ
jgi:hypothetical protein